MSEAAAVRLVVSLLFIVALILAAAWMARRAGLAGRQTDTAIKVAGSQSLGGRGYIALVDIDDTRLVLGVTPSQISLLHSMARPAGAEPDQPSEPSGFARLLRNSTKRRQ